jgi:hypothetical protein
MSLMVENAIKCDKCTVPVGYQLQNSPTWYKMLCMQIYQTCIYTNMISNMYIYQHNIKHGVCEYPCIVCAWINGCNINHVTLLQHPLHPHPSRLTISRLIKCFSTSLSLLHCHCNSD